MYSNGGDATQDRIAAERTDFFRSTSKLESIFRNAFTENRWQSLVSCTNSKCDCIESSDVHLPNATGGHWSISYLCVNLFINFQFRFYWTRKIDHSIRLIGLRLSHQWSGANQCLKAGFRCLCKWASDGQVIIANSNIDRKVCFRYLRGNKASNETHFASPSLVERI